MSSDLKWYGADVVKKLREATETGLVACAIHVQGQAIELVPVKTARLKNDIGYKTKTASKGDLKENVVEGEAVIGTGVFYAPYVELGTGIYAEKGDGRKTPWTYFNEQEKQFFITRGQKPKSFLRKALDLTRKDLPDIFKEYYDKVMK